MWYESLSYITMITEALLKVRVILGKNLWHLDKNLWQKYPKKLIKACTGYDSVYLST